MERNVARENPSKKCSEVKPSRVRRSDAKGGEVRLRKANPSRKSKSQAKPTGEK